MIATAPVSEAQLLTVFKRGSEEAGITLSGVVD